MRNSFFRMMWLLCAIALPYLGFSQNKTVAGSIPDANGNAVANANITIKQSAQGTVTDADGKFKLTVPENAILIISSVGFRSQTIKADAFNGDIYVKLEEDVAHLDEIVVTGLATSVKRRNLANAVSTISAK